MNYGRNAIRRSARELDATSTKIRKKCVVVFWKIFLAVVLIVGIMGLNAGVGIVKGAIESVPDISTIDVIPTGYSTTVLASDGTELATLVAAGANRQYVTLDEIPKDLQNAVVAIEDARFYEHNGIDPKSIVRAFVAGVRNGFHFDQGGSTITQQLIKNNVLTEQWNNETLGKSSGLEKLQRKLQEQYIAIQLEKRVDDKEWILENYLNSINFGRNTLGVQVAARRYFGKDVSELNLSESAVIAGITKNPYGYDPIRFPEKNAERRKLVLDAMLEQDYISKEQYDEALADPVYERISMHNDVIEASMNTYFVDAVIDDVFHDLVNVRGYSESNAYKAIYQGGLTIRTTQDPNIQKIVDEEVANDANYGAGTKYSFFLSFQVKNEDGTVNTYTNQTMLSYYKKVNRNENYSINYSSEEACRAAIAEYEADMTKDGGTIVEDSEYIFITIQPQVAMTIIDQRTGEVKAISGGRGEKAGNRTWNRATNTTRQPGSTFKVLGCYAPALDVGGKTLATVQDDAPLTVGEKTYKEKKYRGYTTVREAITDSINIVTLENMQDIGVNVGYSYVEAFGFSTLKETDKNLGLCLGGLTNGVSNLELTAAYAAIANKGEYIEPSFYMQVLDHDGRVILDNTQTKESHRVLKETTAWLLTDAMKDVLTAGTSTRAYFGPSMAQAGKSGTTTLNRDALFAGYTPYYTCVVWGGYDDNSAQSSTTYPKNLWRAVMKRIHEGLEYRDFEKPQGVTEEKIAVCSKSGLLPVEGVCDKDPRGSMVIYEYFAEDNVPTEMCNHHVKLTICKDSGMVAGANCPEEKKEERVYITSAREGSGDYAYCVASLSPEQLCTKHNVNPGEENHPQDEDDPGVGENHPQDGDDPGVGEDDPWGADDPWGEDDPGDGGDDPEDGGDDPSANVAPLMSAGDVGQRIRVWMNR